MSWQEFVIGLADALAWPLAVVGAVVMLRKPIKVLLERFSGADASAFELEVAGARVRMERKLAEEKEEALAAVEAASAAVAEPDEDRRPSVYGDPVEDDALDAIRRGGHDLIRGLGRLLVNDLKTLLVDHSDADLLAVSEISRRVDDGSLNEVAEAVEVIELAKRSDVITPKQRDSLVTIVEQAFDAHPDAPPTPVLVHYIELSWGLHAHLVRRRSRPPRDTRGLYRDPALHFRREE